MPTVLRRAGFEVRIYTDDHAPAHVHVIKAGDRLVMNLGSDVEAPSIRENVNMTAQEARAEPCGSWKKTKNIYFEDGEEYMAKWQMSNEEFERQFTEARKRGEEMLQKNPRARSAYYDRESQRIVVDLLNGCTFMFPTELAQGLRGVAPDDLAEVEVDPYGLTLHWEKLDADFTIAGLMAGIFGTRAWMEELGRKGGSATPEAKAAASPSNGKRGGRPAQATRKRKSS